MAVESDATGTTVPGVAGLPGIWSQAHLWRVRPALKETV